MKTSFVIVLISLFHIKAILMSTFTAGYKLAALDLDGTTLDSNHQLSLKTVTSLRGLSEKGFQIAIATGRSALSVFEHVKYLDLKQDVYAVCYNGAVGLKIPHNGDDPVTIFSLSVDTDSAKLLINLASSLGLVTQYYNGLTGDVYAVPHNVEHRQLLKNYEILTGKPQIILNDYEEAIQRCQAAKILLLTNDPDTLIQTALATFPPNTFHIIRGSPHPFFVEFLSPGVCKGEGLRLLCESIKMPLEKVIAFGDGENDKEFLQVAGLGVAMKNARPLAKQFADIILDVNIPVFYY